MPETPEEFLTYVVKAIVENPELVRVEKTVDDMGVLLQLSLHPDDMGKVIGRSGNTAKAIRTVMRVVGMKHGARVNIKILEPEGGELQDERPRSELAGDDVIRDLRSRE